MVLKILSIPELNLQESWNAGWFKIKNLSVFEKFMTIFWFAGPLIYLIERDPADIWLTSIGAIFLFRCLKNKEWHWSSQIWFKSALILWLIGLIAALLGPEPLFTFQQGFVWIRFPVYAAAAQVWLAKDRDIRIVMLISILFGMLIMCGILIAETILEPKTRLTWPYNDIVPGGYIGKVSLPLFCVLIAVAVSKKSKAALFAGLIGLLSIGVSILTGERTNFLIRAFGGFLASIVWKPKFIMVAFLVLIEISAVIILLFNRPDLGKRYGENFLKRIPLLNTENKNPHWGSWRGGIQQGLLTPLIGVGPSGTRNSCKFLDTNLPHWLPGKNYCGNHPHNFYIQLFAETGVFGLLAGCVMFASIILTCFKARFQNFNCPMSATAFIIPLALFFPLQQFGSFYGQWGNLFIWFAIGFSISQFQGWRKI